MTVATMVESQLRAQREGGIGVITDGRMRVWVRGPVPPYTDAAHLMHLWDEGNRRARLPLQRAGDKHVGPFEEMMLGFRQLGLIGYAPTADASGALSPAPDWYIGLAGDAYDGDIVQAMRGQGTSVLVPLLSTASVPKQR